METETEAEGVGLLLLVADCVFDEDMDMELVGVAERDKEPDALTVKLALMEEDSVVLRLGDSEIVGEAVMLCVRVEVAENDGLQEAEEELEVEPELERLGLCDREVDEV